MKPTTIPQFLIAAPMSGSGKTSIAMGLMKQFSQMGYQVQPYKCGPDYIDTKFHSTSCGSPSVNLDSFMASRSHLRRLYAQYATEADICIVEGMMGVYDGYDHWHGSSAEIAQWLDLPVILVIDAKSIAYSVAPIMYGFAHYKPKINIAGVIFNRVGSTRHEQMLKEACADVGLDCLGCIPNDKDLSARSRYLGLDYQGVDHKKLVNEWSERINQHIDLDLLIKKTTIIRPKQPRKRKRAKTKLQIAIARNKESFSFIYEETLEKFRQLGTVSFFNPEKDTHLPEGTNLLYIPGGYPENHPINLMKNKAMRNDIYNYIEKGGKTLAECGGLVYLSKGVVRNNIMRDLVGTFPFIITNEYEGRHLTLGYRKLSYNGLELYGHEFHYTQIIEEEEPYPSVVQIYNAKGEKVETPFYKYKNVLASYTHLYLGEINILDLWNNME